MNRDELSARINLFPLFELRDVRVRETETKDGEFVNTESWNAICETGMTKPLAFVGPKYFLMQFKEVFGPILANVEGNVRGHIIKNDGFAAMTLFPDQAELKEGETNFGIVAMNSVDCSSAIVVKFCIEHQNTIRVTVPPKVAGLKKTHQGNVGNVVKDYMSMIGPVKEIWAKIITEFPKKKMVLKQSDDDLLEDELMLGTVLEKLDLGKRLTDKIKKKYEAVTAQGHNYTLWDVFVTAVDRIEEKDFKSEVHKQRKMDTLCERVFQYAMVLSI
jgi:hypothetical protein